MGREVRTNAMRILDSLGISYKTASYEVDEDHLDAVFIAKSANLPVEKVFKTIVMITNENHLFVFVAPAEYEISLKKARELTGAKSIDLLKTDLLRKYTGYIRGGCSPLGMIKQYPTFVEECALLYDDIYVSAGQRGLQLNLNPSDLVLACSGTIASFI